MVVFTISDSVMTFDPLVYLAQLSSPVDYSDSVLPCLADKKGVRWSSVFVWTWIHCPVGIMHLSLH